MLFGGVGCSLLATRPVQEMSDTAAAIKAAREVQADVLAPDFFREASEWFYKAKKEYKFKNFLLAKQYAQKARHFAEQAEFDSIRSGGTRVDDQTQITDPFATGTEAQSSPPPPQDSGPSAAAPAAPPPSGPYPQLELRPKYTNNVKRKKKRQLRQRLSRRSPKTLNRNPSRRNLQLYLCRA